MTGTAWVPVRSHDSGVPASSLQDAARTRCQESSALHCNPMQTAQTAHTKGWKWAAILGSRVTIDVNRAAEGVSLHGPSGDFPCSAGTHTKCETHGPFSKRSTSQIAKVL